MFTFIDLFAGIGGFHFALHQLGGECVYASEWDIAARKTYEINYKSISPNLFRNNLFRGDLSLEENQECIPWDVDILCAGFPCQPFSQAGAKKGFSEQRGTLFFEIAKIISVKAPKSIFLENVKHLLHHDGGKTFDVIHDILKNELDYKIFFQLIKASDYGLPTHRPRLYIVGFRNDITQAQDFEFPQRRSLKFTMSDIFKGRCSREIGFTLRVGGRKSGIHDRRNWDSYEVDGRVHVLNSFQGKKMMGFPESFIFPVTESQALKQLGNSVAVDPVKLIGGQILKVLGKTIVSQ